MGIELKDYPQLRESLRAAYYQDYNTDPTSIIERFFAVTALILDEAYGLLGEVLTRFYLGTAEGEDLDRKGADWGYVRPEGNSAVSMFRFIADPAPSTPIPIPAGTLVQKADGTRYETTEAATLAAGSTHVDVPIKATNKGAAGNADVGTITIIPTMPPGITGGTNVAPAQDGADDASDDQYRQGFLDYLKSLARGTLAAIRTGANQVPGVAQVEVFEDDHARGLVNVRISSPSGGASPELIEQVVAALVDWRAAGVRPNVTGISARIQPIAGTIYLKPGANAATVKAAVAAAAVAFMATLKIGERLVRDRLLLALVNVPGVDLIVLTDPVGDIVPTTSERLVTLASHVQFTVTGQ